jgi:hypothetical protein
MPHPVFSDREKINLVNFADLGDEMIAEVEPMKY